MYKLKRMGVCEIFFGLIVSFLFGRYQRVLLNGQTSKWSQIKAVVPQGSILGLGSALGSGFNFSALPNIKHCGDDTSIIRL